MTGIERLRKVSEQARKRGCPVEHCPDVPCKDCWGIMLADIADKMERERACDSDTAENIRLIVGGVVDEMERHVLGHEGMEDSPVARWARGLREALGGRDEELTDVATIRKDAYDAIAWVREHGGIAYVKDAWNVRRNLDRQLEKAQAKVERQQRHIESIQSKLSERREHIENIANDVRNQCLAFGVDVSECDDEFDMLHDLNEALSKRLMPEGTEWPRFEDGEPVRIGDEISRRDEGGVVNSIELQDGGYFTLHAADGAEDWIIPQYFPGERVRRPAPKAYDADGAEIRVGDTVYHVKDGSEMTVYGIEGEWLVASVGGRVRHDIVTHRAPVLAADGKPLREGETVWSVDSGTRYTVEKITDELIPIKCRSEMGTTVSLHTSQLTHERPDSWERLEADANKNPFDYCKDVRHTCENSEAYKAHDLVRRAKALAGVSE